MASCARRDSTIWKSDYMEKKTENDPDWGDWDWHYLTDEQKDGLFPFEHHGLGVEWYNVDVSQWPMRPEYYNFKNKHLRKYYSDQTTVLFYVHCALDEAGFVTPKHLMNTYRTKNMWVHDTFFDLPNIPEAHLCLKIGLDTRRQFNFNQHGNWNDMVMAYLYRALGRYDLCIAHLQKWRAFNIDLHKDNHPNVRACYSDETWPYPKWWDKWLTELGAPPVIG